MKADCTTSDLSAQTHLSKKQIVRFAAAKEIPGAYFNEGHGPGTGWRFPKSSELQAWIVQHTVCPTMRGMRGRKGRAGYSNLSAAVQKLCLTPIESPIEESWRLLTERIKEVSRTLPPKVRKLSSLRGCSTKRLVDVATALRPIEEVIFDVKQMVEKRSRSNWV